LAERSEFELPVPVSKRSYDSYSLAAFLLVAHVGGVRSILLAHGRSLTSANRITVGITGFGATVATVITVAMLGVHIAAL